MSLPAADRYKEFTGTVSSGALSVTSSLGEAFKLVSVRALFNTAPTTSENFTVKVDAKAGSDYDAVLMSTDPSDPSTTSIWWVPEGEIREDVFVVGNEINVAYTNTDGRTIGVTITLERVV